MPDVENDHVVASATEARAATSGQGLRYVLAFGTIGAVALLVIVYFYFFA